MGLVQPREFEAISGFRWGWGAREFATIGESWHRLNVLFLFLRSSRRCLALCQTKGGLQRSLWDVILNLHIEYKSGFAWAGNRKLYFSFAE